MEASKEFLVACAEGIHARPAACLVKLANDYAGEVLIHYQEQVINAKSIMRILAAGIKAGARIKVVVSGDSPQPVLKEIEELLGGEAS